MVTISQLTVNLWRSYAMPLVSQLFVQFLGRTGSKMTWSINLNKADKWKVKRQQSFPWPFCPTLERKVRYRTITYEFIYYDSWLPKSLQLYFIKFWWMYMQVIKSIQPVCLRLQFPYMCCAGNLIFRRVKSSKNRHPSLGMLAVSHTTPKNWACCWKLQKETGPPDPVFIHS